MVFNRYTKPLFGLLSVVSSALVLVACGGGYDAKVADAAGPAAAADGDSAEAIEAFDFTLENLEGEPVRLSDSAGEIRLLDFWATWCAPCREEIPMLNELQATYGDRGLRILAISDEDAEVIRDFVEKYEVSYLNLVGTEDVSEEYQVLGLPTAYLVDGEGRIIDSFLGPKPHHVLVDRIKELLDSGPAT